MNPDEAYGILEEVFNFLDNESDVKDGPYGEPIPNKAMTLRGDVERILKWLEKMP